MKVSNYSSKELRKLFDSHISPDADVTTDKWKGYKPLAKEYSITQIESDGGHNFKALHIMIHQVKSWLRTIYSWVSDTHEYRYLDEFCYRINRSQMKSGIFNNIIRRMVNADKKYQAEYSTTHY